MEHIAFFDGTHRKRVERHIAVERAMSSKSFFSQLFVLYQPIVHMPARKTIGYEGLVRWDHPDLGRISPCEFIGTTEENGMILDIGAFVIEEAVSTARRLREQVRANTPGADLPFMSINVSPVQLLEDGLPEYILKCLDTSGLPVSSIKLEVTETYINERYETFRRATEAFARVGMAFAIDDFGSGSSAFRRLTEGSFDTIKIDQYFVREMNPSGSTPIITAMSSLAHGSSMMAIAEGIETYAHAKTVMEAGCSIGQGYLFGKPAPASAYLSAANA